MRQADSRRLDRLAGDGNSEAGIDLASLFRVILDQVQDSAGGVRADALMAPVMNGVSNHARVEHWYREKLRGADPWKALIADALDQLELRKLIKRTDDTSHPGDDFATGKRLVVVPARKGMHGQVGVIVREAADRAALGAAEQQRMEIASLAALLREDGPGLRPLDQDHVATLERSMRDHGYFSDKRIVVDREGRILDGRHRMAAASRAGVSMPKAEVKPFDSDEEAVGYAIAVNFQRGWTRDERKRIDSHLRAAGLTVESLGRHVGAAAQRERVRAALMEQAALDKPLSHNAIAKLVDSTQPTVKAECDRLIQSLSITECRHRFTEDGKEAPGPKPKAPSVAEDQVRELLLENPQQSDRKILATVGLNDNHHRVVERVRDRLEDEGAIPVVTAREGSDGTVRHVPHATIPSPSRPPRPTAVETGAEGAWSKIMGRLGRLATAWHNGPPDAAAELEELEALRREIDERIEALRR